MKIYKREKLIETKKKEKIIYFIEIYNFKNS